MQTDMHYYATYAMARAAGIEESTVRTIATAAEYVDDSDRLDVTCKDGFEVHAWPTAHHPTDFKDNSTPEDQVRTWVPFHFIPGNRGNTLDEKLLCVTDSDIARAVVEHTLKSLEKPFGICLLGILAHSYVDTFSHYGFSGISSKLNKIDVNSIELTCSDKIKKSMNGRLNSFFAKYAVGPLANFLLQLGHGSVATYPDQPYLAWQFRYESGGASGLRENQKTFLAGCRRLHETFTRARKSYNGDQDDLTAFREFDDIEAAVKRVLAIEEEQDNRAVAWQREAAAGNLFGVAATIPPYDSGMFSKDLEQFNNYDEKFVSRTLVYGFLQAADYHRNYVLNELLPQNEIHIESANIEWHTERTV